MRLLPDSMSKLHSGGTQKAKASQAQPRKKRRRSWLKVLGIVVAVIVLVAACIRPMLPWVVRSYVNRTLDRNLQYEGRIGDVTLDLWRGAYSIDDVRIFKRTGMVPDPLFRAKRLELAIQWDAILHGKIVGEVVMDRPELNFVASSDESESQSGAGGPWLQTLTALFPFSINSAQFHDGSIHFKSYKNAKPVDIYMDNLEASIDDLTNIQDRTTPMLTTINASAMVMDQAKFQFRMKMDPFSYRPTFHLATRVIGLDVTQINDLALTYGQFAFKQGFFDLVVEMDASEGQVTGYAKPLFRNLKVFDVVQDLKYDANPLQFFWQALLGVATGVLTNQQRDQFGTLIPFTGDLSAPNADILTMVGNILRNAFVRAYLPRLENGTNEVEGMQFEPASILTSPSSIGDDEQ